MSSMSCFNVPNCRWFLCMVYICFVLNHMVDPNLGDGTMTPFMVATFEMSDISPITAFHFGEKVYFLEDVQDQSFPEKAKERAGRFVGIAENISHKMTFLLLEIYFSNSFHFAISKLEYLLSTVYF